MLFFVRFQSEDIKLDPRLQDHCRADIDQFCANLTPGGGVILHCLQKNAASLSPECKDMVLKREVSQH